MSIRCEFCHAIYLRNPHKRPGVDVVCDGTAWTIQLDAMLAEAGLRPTVDVAAVERLAETHFNIMPLSGIPLGTMMLVGANGSAAMVTNMAPPEPVVVVLAQEEKGE